MILKEKERKIFERLEELDPKIAETFRGGIEVLETNYSERIAQSAHSLREVIYLLTRMDEIKQIGRVKTISKGKTRKQDLIKNLDPIKGTPEEIYVLYDELVEDKLKWFSAVAHHSEVPNEDKFRKKVIDFENLLEKILRPHFEVIDEINKIIGVKNPTENDFKSLKQLISNSSRYTYFFENASSTWLPFLLKEKYLKSPKHILEIDGEKRFSGWSPSKYLWRSAVEKPDEVSKIILGFNIPKKQNERNPWLLDYFVKAAVAMPPKNSKLIAQKIYKEKWIETSYQHYLDRPISELMKKLGDAGLEKETTLLARTLLNVKLGEQYITGGIIEEYKKRQDVKPVVDSYWYGELLKNEIPYVFEKVPKAITSLLVDILTNLVYLENIGRGDKNSKTDASVGWRPAIEDNEQNWDLDFRSQLLGKLGNFLILLGQKSMPLLKQVLKKISQIEYPVFRRLELYVYWMFPKYFKKEINHSIEKYFDNYELHHEYFHLLQNTFSIASKKTKKNYLSFIEKGPDKEHLELWDEQAKHQQEGFLDFKIKLWKADKIKPVVSHLTKKEIKKFENIIGEERGFPHPDFHIFTEGAKMSEPVSELKDNLSTEEVLDFIKNHKPKELGFGYHDGTPEKFRDYVKNNSENYSKLALKCLELDSTFTERFLDGVRDAVKQKSTIGWEQVLSLCEKMIESIKEGKYNERMGSILQSIAWLLEDGLSLDAINFAFRDKVWNLLKTLTNFQDPDSPSETDYPREDWDALSISINSVDGITFHAIMRYAIWCEKHLNKKSFFVPEVRELLSDYLEQKLPATISRQVVLAHYLPALYYYDKDWIKGKLSSLFSNQNEILSRAAWDAYLTRQVYSSIFKDLITQYNVHVKKLNSPPLKYDKLWEFDERVIKHITTAYLFKFKESDKLFNYMIIHSHEKVLSHCAWHIGRILKEQKEKSNKSFDSEAFKKLWKSSPLTSNEELHMWVKYSPFDKTQTLQLLYNSLKKSTKSIRFLSFLVKELESYAKTHAQSTLKCLDLLIHTRANDPAFHITRENLRNVLQILLKNKKTKKRTTTLIHYLGELGYNEYKDLLEDNK